MLALAAQLREMEAAKEVELKALAVRHEAQLRSKARAHEDQLRARWVRDDDDWHNTPCMRMMMGLVLCPCRFFPAADGQFNPRTQ
eukprot:COSAG01_NODE_2291_length_7969_cov_29.830623_3_plen_85_part_00